MRPFLYIITAAALFLFSCADLRKDHADVGNYYVSIVTSLISPKQQQDIFMNKCTSIINDISDEKPLNIDTTELRTLMENAQNSGNDAIQALNDLNEVDSTISLKSKSIDYLQTANNLYDSSFSAWITLVGNPKRNKSTVTLDLLYDGVKKLSAKRKGFEKAQRSFINKYNIQTF